MATAKAVAPAKVNMKFKKSKMTKKIGEAKNDTKYAMAPYMVDVRRAHAAANTQKLT